ncbi:Protein root UVB sensitive 4 [Picochlorum sp. SENEW3]|nr:Protein root UVB sensitive 4 [Picochlorum sp. SENEW3]WPT18609.1 Protein root UVB sensitive 4 [Picochlorum sp. SENEW3]
MASEKGGSGSVGIVQGGEFCWEGRVSGVRFCSASMGVLATNASETMAYVWDGKRVAIQEYGKEGSQCDGREHVSSSREAVSWVGDAQKHFRRRIESLHSAFFPRRDMVTPDYWEYVKWRGWHRLFSSMVSIFSTQSLLLAVGVGAKKTLPAAAGINWVLKDGLGRLGRLTVATRFGESFDSDLKRFRFASSLVYGGAVALDYLTPLMPAYFLPMAAVANIGKSVGLTTYIATQPAFFKSFAKSENIADISAKAQAQQMAIDTLGLALAVSLNLAVRRHDTARRFLPLALFPILVPADLYSIYNELRSVHLRTLNKERAEFLAKAWVEHGHVPTPDVVSRQERLVLPPLTALGTYPLTIMPLEESLKTKDSVDAFIQPLQRKKKKYFLSVENAPRRDVSVTLRHDAETRDILEMVLVVAYLRRDMPKMIDMNAHGPGSCSVSEKSKAERRAISALPRFLQQLKEAGWQIDPITLSRTERLFYK